MVAITRLGSCGYGTRTAGSFNNKVQKIMAAITRLGSGGYGTRRNGSFASKTLYVPALPARDLTYIPGPVPYDGADLVRYLEFELYRISAVLAILISGFTTKVYAEPTRPRDGDTVLADGTEWNPGSGQGVYCYYNNTWNKL